MADIQVSVKFPNFDLLLLSELFDVDLVKVKSITIPNPKYNLNVL